MAERWTLNRAGIINVFQYEDETIHFGGGRLLLRGVNGSGKSSAMNMLLPFLIEADVRRIDAAGDQSAVLRSWMLSGRDEQQPVGYLWIEFVLERDGEPPEYLVCGCGIKANRSTDRVTHWWFVTDQRPGIDVSFLDHRQALSTDSLRTALGPHAVFTMDQRDAYRSELAARLYGGADLERHLRLLHVVRSPRVGDRITVELQNYLSDALPQLSERAVEDAAQPLEDLEEFRRNVEQLTRTASTLGALGDVYRSYARAELRRRAESLRTAANVAREDRRAAELAAAAHTAAVTAATQTREHVARLEAEQTDAARAVAALEKSDEYRKGRELDELRQQVVRLNQAVAGATTAAERALAALARADATVKRAEESTADAHDRLRRAVEDLAATTLRTGLGVRHPAVPVVASHLLARPELPDLGDGSGTPAEQVRGPDGQPDTQPLRDGLAQVRGAAQARVADVQRVRDAVTRATSAELELRAAERRVLEARERVETARTRLDEHRLELSKLVERWRDELRTWLAQVDQALAHAGLAPMTDAERVELPDLAEQRHELLGVWRADTDRLVEHHEVRLAALELELTGLAAEVARVEQQLDELSGRTHPEVPTAPWQTASSGWHLADLVDFAEGVGDAERIGLESALHAAGLLGAEVLADGKVVLEDGQLLARATQKVEAPLSALLTVILPDASTAPDVELRAGVPDEQTVRALLDSISTQHAAAAESVVATDGSFRLGALTGRSLKSSAEHIGVTARRAAIERRRVELSNELEQVRASHEATTERRDDEAGTLTAVRRLRATPPESTDISRAEQQTLSAVEQLALAEAEHADRVEERHGAEQEHATLADAAHRLHVQLHLPLDEGELRDVELALGGTRRDCDAVEQACTQLEQTHRQWHSAARERELSIVAAVGAADELSDRQRDRDPVAMELASLEDAVGASYAEVLAAIEHTRGRLAQLDQDLTSGREQARQRGEDAVRADEQSARATAVAEASSAAAVRSMTPLTRAAQVPGVWLAAVPPPTSKSAGDGEAGEDGEDGDGPDTTGGTADSSPAAVLPTVSADADGALALADDVLRQVPAPERAGVSAEGVRQSLRARRNELGAGWDAEDHQADDSLPLVVEVTGPNVSSRAPLAIAEQQVRASLSQQSGLLTTKQDQALRNLLQGLIAKEVADKMVAAQALVALMNDRLSGVTTSHGVGTTLRWRRRRDVDDALSAMIDLLSIEPDLRTSEQDRQLSDALSSRIEFARREDPEASYRDLIATVLDYRDWHDLDVLLLRPNAAPQLLSRRTALSEGEKKLVSYLPLFAAVAASCDALAADEPAAPRFVLLDDAFAKVSEDNHPRLFGLLVELDLDFIATSERLWGTHATVPELAITEVLRDAELGVIALEHSRWNGRERDLV